ncbi:MAG: hypothetical protein ACOYOQ_11775 [Microthrixaceae bacterium]
MAERWAWQLPGPRRWLASAASHLRRGSSALIEVPPARDVAAILEALSEAAGISSIRIDDDLVADVTDEREVRTLLGQLVDSEIVAPSLPVLTEQLQGLCIELSVDAGSPPSPVLDVIEQLSRFSSPGTGVRFIVAGPPGAHPGGPHFQVIAFKGVFERHDTAAYVHGRLRQRSEQVDDWTTAAITEVASFDLDLADTLIDDWDGDPETLQALLEVDRSTEQWTRPVGAFASDDRTEFIDSWKRGIGDWWDSGRFIEHARHTDSDEIDRRLWLASLRSTWPELERARSGVVTWVATQGHVVRHLNGPPNSWEFSELADVIEPRFRMNQPALVSLVRDMQNLRNRLAHMEPLGKRARNRVRQLLVDAEREIR